MTAAPVRHYTPEEYYRLEEAADYKSDYYDGEIFAMAGGSPAHSLIVINIGRELSSQLKGKPCATYDPNMRLKVVATGLRTYPDVSVYCGPLEYDPQDVSRQTLTNPTVLFEVLSPTTELYDRNVKGWHFRRIESLQALVLVAQDKPRAEAYFRQTDGTWALRDVEGLEESLSLPLINVTLKLREIYDRVDFSTPAGEMNSALNS
jgi:Uma2 family endonuclease